MLAQAEHRIFRGQIANIPFMQPKPCDRCPVTQINQETGEKRGTEPLTTLATYKNWENINRERKVIFGENMVPLGTGPIQIGDDIVSTELRDPPLVYGSRT